jgi:hypothetical protein
VKSALVRSAGKGRVVSLGKGGGVGETAPLDTGNTREHYNHNHPPAGRLPQRQQKGSHTISTMEAAPMCQRVALRVALLALGRSGR